MKRPGLESINSEGLGDLVEQLVLKNDKFLGTIAVQVGKARRDLEIRPHGDTISLMVLEAINQSKVGTQPARRGPGLAITRAGADENLGVEAHTQDRDVAAHVERPSIPCDQLVDSVAVEVGKFIIGGVEQLVDGLAIRRDKVGGAPVRASLNID